MRVDPGSRIVSRFADHQAKCPLEGHGWNNFIPRLRRQPAKWAGTFALLFTAVQ